MKSKGNIQLNQRIWVLVFGLAVCICGLTGAEPELKVIPQDGHARPHSIFRIECEVSWVGEPSEYAILPAEADAIDWGTIVVGKARSFVRDENGSRTNIVSQVLEITPEKAGEFKSPEIRVSYLNPEATSPAEKAAHGTAPSASSASPSLRAEPFTIVVRPARLLVWISGGLGASLLLTALGWWSARLKRGPQPPLPSEAADLSVTQQAMHQARQRRLDGNFYEFYQELARAVEGLPTEHQADGGKLAGRLRSCAQEAGYKGVRPTDDQMDGDVRDVERALAHYKETFGS